MSDEVEILLPEEQLVEPETAVRGGIGFKTLLTACLLTAVLGAIGGAGLSHYLLPKAEPVNTGPITANIDRLETSVKSLRTDQAKLERSLRNAPAAESVDLSPLEARLSALENAPVPEMPEPQLIDEDLVARLEALQEIGSPALDLSDIENRLDSLESIGVSDETREMLRDIYERQAELEIALEDTQSKLESVQTKVSETRNSQTPPDTIPLSAAIPFPKAALIAAVEDNQESGGFFDRAMKKHIRVKDGDDPYVLIDTVEAALARGDIETAKAKFDQLPSQVRSAAADWRQTLN